MSMKARNLINSPVLDQMSGRLLGVVQDIDLDGRYRLRQLAVRAGGKTFAVETADFEIGADAVLVNGEACLKPAQNGDDHWGYHEKLGLRVFDPEGGEVGIIADVLVDTARKAIIGLELSAGMIHDFLNGRTDAPLDRVAVLEENQDFARE